MAFSAFTATTCRACRSAFQHFGFDEWASDYVVLDGAVPHPRRLDLPAHLLPQLLLDRLRRREAIEPRLAEALGAA